MIFLSPVFSAVDIDFDFNESQWERNGIYEFSLVLNNNDAESVKIAGVQADFAYESEDFKEAPILVHDYITGYNFTVNTVNTLTEGLVYYSKGIKVTGSPNYFTVGANGTKTLATFRLRVENGAALAASDFTFQVTVAVDRRLDGGGTESVLGTANDGQITVVADETAPGSYAIPGGCTLLQGDSTEVVLDETTTPNYDDLVKIYYEVGEGTASDPTPTSSWVSEGGTVELPVNDASHPGAVTGVLKFFGEDGWGNREGTINTETYTIDIIDPTISGQSRSPELAREGTEITVNFTVDEVPGTAPTVEVNNHAFTPGGSYPNYSYTYTVQSNDAEGNRPIEIAVEDGAGNEAADSSLSVRIDRTGPTYTPVSFSPDPATTGDTLTIIFDASEELDTGQTAVSIDGRAATYTDASGRRYTYSYTIAGTEASSFIKVHGYDPAGNDSWNNQGWGLVEVSGSDQYGNPGSGSAEVDIEFKRRP